MSAAIGFTVPAVLPSGDSTSLSCTYSTGGINSVEINYQKAPAGANAATLQAQANANASAGSTIKPLSGYGQAALSNVTAGQGVGLLVLNDGIEFSVVGGTSLSGVENLARYVLTH